MSIDAYEVRPRCQISVAARRVARMNFEVALETILYPPDFCSFLGPACLRMSRQAIMHKTEPTNAEIRSSKVILISPRPKSMWSNRKISPPTKAPSIPTPMLTQSPNPRLVKVMRRPATVPASAPTISQTIILLIEVDRIESFLLGECLRAPDCAVFCFTRQRQNGTEQAAMK